MIEEEESSRMNLEDTIAKLIRIEVKCKEQVDRNGFLRQQKDRAAALSEEDVVVNRALARSKPLVTEIMEYFNHKENENNNKDERIETLVEGL
jgi:CRISPR/Cas system-associated endonuclease Cas3-HD